jgi:hypothetical protein
MVDETVVRMAGREAEIRRRSVVRSFQRRPLSARHDHSQMKAGQEAVSMQDGPGETKGRARTPECHFAGLARPVLVLFHQVAFPTEDRPSIQRG